MPIGYFERIPSETLIKPQRPEFSKPKEKRLTVLLWRMRETSQLPKRSQKTHGDAFEIREIRVWSLSGEIQNVRRTISALYQKSPQENRPKRRSKIWKIDVLIVVFNKKYVWCFLWSAWFDLSEVMVIYWLIIRYIINHKSEFGFWLMWPIKE